MFIEDCYACHNFANSCHSQIHFWGINQNLFFSRSYLRHSICNKAIFMRGLWSKLFYQFMSRDEIEWLSGVIVYNRVRHPICVLRSYVAILFAMIVQNKEIWTKKDYVNYYLLHNTNITIQFSIVYYIPNSPPTYFFKLYSWTTIQCLSQTLYTILWNTIINSQNFRSNTHLLYNTRKTVHFSFMYNTPKTRFYKKWN